MLTTILDWLNTPVFTAFGAPTTWVEVLGFIFGLLAVIYAARNSWVTWPTGIVNGILWVILFFGAGLYADGALQFVYIALGVLGWIAWVKKDATKKVRPITNTTLHQWAFLTAFLIAGTAGMMWFLSTYTASTVPFWDALTTVISLAAVWGQVYRKLQSWYLWILVDVVYVPLYIYKGLTLTAILYVVFMILCIYGLITWRRIRREELAMLTTETLTPLGETTVTLGGVR